MLRNPYLENNNHITLIKNGKNHVKILTLSGALDFCK